MEDGLGVCGIPGHRESSLLVLILVLVEDGLGEYFAGEVVYDKAETS